MLILNLGCGTKTSPLCVNIDWSIHLRLRRSRAASSLALRVLQGERLERFRAIDTDRLVVRDLRRGIPFPDGTVDAVYHSHLLEHIDRAAVPMFLAEIFRVLRPGGMHRIVVPDWEEMCRAYIAHLEVCAESPDEQLRHDGYIATMIEQLVRTEGYGSTQQRPLQRKIENFILGDARRRGEAHRWMYDRVSLGAVLANIGFEDIQRRTFLQSAITNWRATGLDEDSRGAEYKPKSLYIEAIKPVGR